MEKPPASLHDGEIAILVMRLAGMKLRWIARHRDFIDRGEQGGEFKDDQVKGPFRRWTHHHIVRAIDGNHCELEDRIDYRLPLGMLGEWVLDWFVRRKLSRMFAYRHEVTRRAVEIQR